MYNRDRGGRADEERDDRTERPARTRTRAATPPPRSPSRPRRCRRRSRTPARIAEPARDRSVERTPTAKRFASESEYANVKLADLHDVFREHPDLEQKYLKIMRLPITGKESIRLPFDFRSHRQHTCLDLSPYGNDQVFRSACTACKEGTSSPTASDSMMAFINQTSNVVRHRKFYFGFRKNLDLLKQSANQPQLFQIYYIVQACIPEITPFLYLEHDKLHMQLIFENETVHVPSQCIEQILLVARDLYRVSIDIAHQHLTLTATCVRQESTSVRIDVLILQRKVDEMDIPNEVNEKFERYSM
ncbi:pR53 [rat cytomegalovirus strain Maastricht]|uniref:PR53 n=1 Tax=Rat cytomegalovirus (strain Maastricht) TaxID=79700 RepID=Q9DWD7_RCMVM|nr:pR53 [rat cytomegalovirus strain Maastricht]AAF99152.1 pR53 [rat cytomegalovirus strain Maastricht]WEG71980.1 nuclear egress lamina protein [Murid betaherpesvirus 2]